MRGNTLGIQIYQSVGAIAPPLPPPAYTIKSEFKSEFERKRECAGNSDARRSRAGDVERKPEVGGDAVTTPRRSESVLVPATIAPPTMHITDSVLKEIYRRIGTHQPELGGMLGAAQDSDLVTHFFFDDSAKTNCASYSPNIANVNNKLREWNAIGVRLRGFVHSHPKGLTRPSYADEMYAAQLMAHNTEMPVFFMPIVQCEVCGQKYSIHPFACIRDGEKFPVLPCKLIINERNFNHESNA
ncbi:UBA/ThiF-type NAD/FAD-binding protein [Candidatus Symbiobacter mobilis CR]|uniref:UBA/ThiF-type NAD/FAD-binding protein n=2 Tax=Candidatus Symbiobacter TaxID=1436289 RepID=U5NEY1_9BURK|nr:UBA/ThiF-type NAD/FAD-binding protein [Candidatus Symbiobacter mobilis CR]